MGWAGPGVARRQFREVDRMGIEGIETDHIAGLRGHNVDARIAGLGELVCGLAEVVVDRVYAAGKSFPIMALRIEQLDDDRVPLFIHLLMTRDLWLAKAFRKASVGGRGLSRALKKAS